MKSQKNKEKNTKTWLNRLVNRIRLAALIGISSSAIWMLVNFATELYNSRSAGSLLVEFLSFSTVLSCFVFIVKPTDNLLTKSMKSSLLIALIITIVWGVALIVFNNLDLRTAETITSLFANGSFVFLLAACVTHTIKITWRRYKKNKTK